MSVFSGISLLCSYIDSGNEGPEMDTLRKSLIEKRIGLREEKARQLIDSRKFNEAEEHLLDWELSKEGVPLIPKLYAYMEELKKDIAQVESRKRQIENLIKYKYC